MISVPLFLYLWFIQLKNNFITNLWYLVNHEVYKKEAFLFRTQWKFNFFLAHCENNTYLENIEIVNKCFTVPIFFVFIFSLLWPTDMRSVIWFEKENWNSSDNEHFPILKLATGLIVDDLNNIMTTWDPCALTKRSCSIDQ